MTKERFDELRRRLRASAGRSRVRRGAAVTVAAAVLGVGASAGSTPGPDWLANVERVSVTTKGDLSDAQLVRLAPDAASFALAQRHDPNLVEPDLWGRLPGWESLDVTQRPDIGVGRLEGDRAQRINASIPGVAAGLQPAAPFVFRGSEADRKRALRCLAQAVYYEAAHEPRRGQEAVAQVVLNRVRDPNYPSTVCGVVFQGAQLQTGCQFSFTCDGSMARGAGGPIWRTAEEIAGRALSGYVAEWVGTASHYHADYVYPYWAPTLIKLETVGRHIFYRWPGTSGLRQAMVQRHAGREPWINETLYARPRTPAAELVQVSETTEGGKRFTMTVDLGKSSPAGLRRATPDDIRRINETLNAFERGEPAAPSAPAVSAPAWQEPQSSAPAVIR